jgi:hypothetical protein
MNLLLKRQIRQNIQLRMIKPVMAVSAQRQAIIRVNVKPFLTNMLRSVMRPGGKVSAIQTALNLAYTALTLIPALLNGVIPISVRAAAPHQKFSRTNS